MLNTSRYPKKFAIRVFFAIQRLGTWKAELYQAGQLSLTGLDARTVAKDLSKTKVDTKNCVAIYMFILLCEK
jgi:hypothetical protein